MDLKSLKPVGSVDKKHEAGKAIPFPGKGHLSLEDDELP